jgi:spermidine synthase
MKNKHGGQLVYATEDEFGPIEIIEFQQTIRGLHFGNKTQQSGMFLYNPIVLIHKYTQAMLTPLCWQVPKQTLILGLGAGSIAKYLLHFFPDIHIDAIDLRPEVVNIAHEYFSLPEQNEQFKIHFTSASDFINAHSNSKYDFILIDLFLTSDEKDITVDISENIEQLGQLLTSDGYLCINIIGSEYLNYSGLEKLREVFLYNIYVIPVELSNVILIASHNTIPTNDASIDFTTMETRFGLPFLQHFNQMTQA